MMFVSCEGFPSSFEGCRLILPSISVGNVGQLAVDLLINSFQLKRVGYLHHPGLLPLVGNDAFDHTPQTGQLHTTAEVYYGAEKKIAVVQIRAPLAKGFQQSFSINLLKWMRESGFTEVVLLTSSYAHERRDIQIQGRQYRFLLNSQSSNLYTHFTGTLNWTTLESRGEPDVQSSPKDVIKDTVLNDAQFFLPGSGLTKKLYFDSMAENVRMVVLIAFCSQGDNVLDATGLVSYLNEWLKLKPQTGKVSNTETCTASWQCPESWSLMYGGPSPENLF